MPVTPLKKQTCLPFGKSYLIFYFHFHALDYRLDPQKKNAKA